MQGKYKKIPMENLSEHCGLRCPEPVSEGLSLDSSALSLVTDFSKTSATTAHDSITVDSAIELMRVNRVRSLMIMASNGEFAGIVTSMDLMGRKPIQYADGAGIPRADVLVRDIMLPKHKLKAIDRNAIERCSLGDVMNALISLHEQHVLVVDGKGEDMKISGLISASDFKRALGINFETSVVASTFSELERVIHEHQEVG